jgi:type I restriction enzyme S subunit
MEKQLSSIERSRNVPQLRFSEFQGDWVVKKMGHINNVLDSLHQTPKEYVKQGYSMVRVTDVNNGVLDINKCLKVSKKDYLEFTKRHTPVKDDIIMSRVGTCGESIKLSTNVPVCLGQNTVLLIPNVNKNYVFSFMKSRVFKNQVDRMVVGSTQKTLSLKDLKKFKINLHKDSL